MGNVTRKSVPGGRRKCRHVGRFKVIRQSRVVQGRFRKSGYRYESYNHQPPGCSVLFFELFHGGDRDEPVCEYERSVCVEEIGQHDLPFQGRSDVSDAACWSVSHHLVIRTIENAEICRVASNGMRRLHGMCCRNLQKREREWRLRRLRCGQIFRCGRRDRCRDLPVVSCQFRLAQRKLGLYLYCRFLRSTRRTVLVCYKLQPRIHGSECRVVLSVRYGDVQTSER